MEVERFLRTAVDAAATLGKVHEQASSKPRGAVFSIMLPIGESLLAKSHPRPNLAESALTQPPKRQTKLGPNAAII